MDIPRLAKVMRSGRHPGHVALYVLVSLALNSSSVLAFAIPGYTSTRYQESMVSFESPCCSSIRRLSDFRRRALALEAASGGTTPEKDADEDGELVGVDEFFAQKAERERQQELFGGGIFPSDVGSTCSTDEITVQAAKLDAGRPEALVGFWKLYGSTAKREDISGRVILRADGQVIGGPTVRTTPGVSWSDPEGMKPVGGEWVVYKDPKTRRPRMNMTINLSHQEKQRLVMDGVVMMVDSYDDHTGECEPQPQVFGGVSKRKGGAEMDTGEGDFSMMKIATGEDKLVATVGSQQKRFW